MKPVSSEVISAAPNTKLTISYTDVNGMKQAVLLPADHVIIATATSNDERNQYACMTWGDGPIRAELLKALLDTLSAEGLVLPDFLIDTVESLNEADLVEFLCALKASAELGILAYRTGNLS